MNIVKHMTAALVLLPAVAMALPQTEQEALTEAFTELAIQKGVIAEEQVVAEDACLDATCLIENISVKGYACLLDNLSALISLAGEYDANAWPLPVDGEQTATFDITAEFKLPIGDFDPDDYIGTYTIDMNYASSRENLLGEIVAKPINAQDEFMWNIVGVAYNGFRLLGLKNCSAM